MKQEFSESVQTNSEGKLFISLKRKKTFYGSLMKAWIEVEGEQFLVRPHDLTTHLIITLPDELIAEKQLKDCDTLSGTISSKDFISPKLPDDVREALEQQGLDFKALPLPQQRQGLLFIGEAKNPHIRTLRIQILVMACQQAKGAKTTGEQ